VPLHRHHVDRRQLVLPPLVHQCKAGVNGPYHADRRGSTSARPALGKATKEWLSGVTNQAGSSTAGSLTRTHRIVRRCRVRFFERAVPGS
jgi:hypothetical protein